MPSLRGGLFGTVPLFVLACTALAGELRVCQTSPHVPLFCLAHQHSAMSRSAGSASAGKSQTGGSGGGGGGGGEHQPQSQSRNDIGTGWGGYPMYGGPALFPGFHTLDRLYSDMMDNVDRVRAELDRLYYTPFGMGAPYTPALGGGAPPPALRAGSSNLQLATAPGGGGRGGGGGSILPYYRGGRGSSFDLMSPFMFPMFGGGSMMPFSRGGGAVVPRVDFQDLGNEYLLQADLPGIDKSNVKVQVHNGVLHISGEQHQETKDQQQGYFMQERYQSSFSRQLPLPENVREDDIRATMKDGVLEVHLPKIASEKSNVKKVHVE